MTTPSASRQRLSEVAGQFRHPVVAVGLGMIGIHLAFRASALYPSWFYNDDYRLLHDASLSPLDWAYLTSPFDSQFMPIGRFIAWVVAHDGPVNWALAATITLALQMLVDLACLWMLATLFGRRWGILAPLALYLGSAMTVSATMWWAASLNHLPMMLFAFVAVGCWVRYLRSSRLLWVVLTAIAIALGLLAYVKTVFVIGLLAAVLLTMFTSGSPLERFRDAIRRYWPAAVVLGVVSGAFLFYYTQHVPSAFEAIDPDIAGPLADSMLGTAFTSAAVGGPWTWSHANPPAAVAAPRDWVVHLSWVVLAFFVAHTLATRERVGRVWLILAAYAGAAYLLLLTSRAQVVGAVAGLEYRYLADVTLVLILCVGLATMPLLGAREGTRPRAQPFLTRPLGGRTAAALTAVVTLFGVVSTTSYVRIWHNDNPGAEYVRTARAALRDSGSLTFARQSVPDPVIAGFLAPSNSTERLLPLLSDNVTFPKATGELVVLDSSGRPRQALIERGVASEVGPIEGCGYRISGPGSITIPLDGTAFQWRWWVRIGYLASGDSAVTVIADETVVDTEVEAGLHSLFVEVDGSFDSVTIEGLEVGVRLCVDVVEVGNPVPGGDL